MKELKPGQYSRKNKKLFISLIVFVFITAVIIGLVMENRNQNSTLFIVIYAGLGTLASFIVCLLLDPVGTLNRKFMKNADWKSYVEGIDNILEKEYLHKDSINYLLTLKTNALIFESLEKSDEVFKDVERPNLKQYAITYDAIKFCYALNHKEKENAYNILEYLQKNAPLQYQQLYRRYLLVFSDAEIPNIESFYKYDTKKKFQNIVNLNVLVEYYNSRKNIEKRNEYCKVLLPMVDNFTELKEKITRMLGE